MKNSSQASTKIGDEGYKTFQDLKSPHDLTAKDLTEKQILIENNNQYQYSFDFGIRTEKILECFVDSGCKMYSIRLSSGFTVVEREKLHATIIKQRKWSVFNIFNCINNEEDADYTAIKMTIKTSECNSTRIARIYGLVGAELEFKRLASEFKKKASALMQQNHNKIIEEIEEDEQASNNPFYLEVCAEYAFFKILSLENYGLGRNLATRIKEFRSRVSTLESQTYKNPIKSMANIIQFVVGNLFQEFNSGRKQMEKLMPYCRISVEKYVCEKLYDVIEPIYIKRFQMEEEQFRTNRFALLSNKCLQEILEELCLNKKFWLIQEKGIPPSYRQIIANTDIKQIKQFRYTKAIEELEKIKSTHNLREKLKYCQLMHTKMKNLVSEFYNGKIELVNMEDTLPLTICVVLLCNVPGIRAELEMVCDFVEMDQCDQDIEKRLLTNLKESINYIRRDWKLSI